MSSAAHPTRSGRLTPTQRPATKRWRYREYDPAVADRLKAEHRVPALVATLLAQRGITAPEQAAGFLKPDLTQLHDPFRMLGMREAAERLRRAIANHERILIYGDYDVDGTTAVVLLRKAIEMAGGQADFHVPHRVKEGYGMREEVIERAAKDQVRLLVSVDTGIREGPVVERARQLGIDCIVTDHHLPDTDLPRALAVLNPNQPGCSYPDKNLSGVGVAFKLSQALLSGLGWPEGRLQRVLESMLKMVAIGTFADMVPLAGENRIFAKLGLEGLRQAVNPGLKALLAVAGLGEKKALTTGDVGFRIGPRLNAAGRMDTAREVIELFTTSDEKEAERLAQKLDQLNSERQKTENELVEEIIRRLDKIPPPAEMPFIVAEGQNWHAGVIGIVASRVLERYHRPTLVLSIDPATGLATGSGRSIAGYHLLEGLQSTAEIFERFGGHRHAAGCTLASERIPELRTRLHEHAGRALRSEDFVPALHVDAELPFARITDSMMEQIARLAPHGLGNPTPVFSAANVRLKADPKVIKEKHLRLRLEHERVSLTAMAWRMAERAEELGSGAVIETAFAVEPDTYWGGWQLNLKDFRVAGGSEGG